MERKIGNVFKFEGKWLKVQEGESLGSCEHCYFEKEDCSRFRSFIGVCTHNERSDKKGVIFEDITHKPEENLQAEQPQKQEEQELNLCEILKNCPGGTELWSDNYGKVQFLSIEDTFDKPIITSRTDGLTAAYTKEGWHRKDFPANCLLWPSRDCRDWS